MSQSLADALKALAHPMRISILRWLLDDELAATDVLARLREQDPGIVNQMSVVTYHLHMMRAAGVIELARVVEVRGGKKKVYRPTTFGRELGLLLNKWLD